MTTFRDEMVALLSQESFGKSIRDQVRALFFGVIDPFQFQDAMFDVFERHFEQAWAEGAAECGIKPEERTAAEADRLNSFIFEQANFLPTFASHIADTREAAIAAGDLDPVNPNTRQTKNLRGLFTRARMWENRWGEVKALAQQMACADRKGTWRVNPRKEHCGDCARVDGRTYRMSVWQQYGWHPRSSDLECGGFYCGCTIEITEAPVTPGRPPALLGG